MALISRVFLVPKILASVASIIERSRYREEIRLLYSSAGNLSPTSAVSVGYFRDAAAGARRNTTPDACLPPWEVVPKILPSGSSVTPAKGALPSGGPAK